MGRTSGWVREYRSLGLLLVLVAVLTAAVISSCGSGGSNADGGLCSQCGDDPDGPCHTFVNITPGENGVHCNSELVEDLNPDGTCRVFLKCRRKSDSGQQRCYPVAPGPGNPADKDVDYQVRCDGSRPGGTPIPQPTNVTPSPATTSTVPPVCNNGILESGEECDGNNFGGKSCATFTCTDPFGGNGLSCDSFACTIIVSGCIGICSLTP
jgi:hypothetical protein